MKREKTNLSNYILIYPHAEKRRVAGKRESAKEPLLLDMPLFSLERTLTTKHCSYVSLKLDPPHHTPVHKLPAAGRSASTQQQTQQTQVKVR